MFTNKTTSHTKEIIDKQQKKLVEKLFSFIKINHKFTHLFCTDCLIKSYEGKLIKLH